VFRENIIKNAKSPGDHELDKIGDLRQEEWSVCTVAPRWLIGKSGHGRFTARLSFEGRFTRFATS